MPGNDNAAETTTTSLSGMQFRRSRGKWKTPLILLCISLLPALLWTTSFAAVFPAALEAKLEQRFDAYAGAEGFDIVDPEQLLDKGWYDSHRFPNHPTTAISSPDAHLHPLTRAVLLLESREKPLPHARYRISYRLEAADADFPDLQHAYVEVVRFNLGPARHADTVENYGEHAAPIAEFGVGPNVAWRFVMGSVMGMRADVLRASHKTLNAKDVAAADCLGSPCTHLPDTDGPQGSTWKEFSPDTGKATVVYADRHGFTPNAARIADDLITQATQYGEDAALADGEAPSMIAVISLNVDGQDDIAIGTLLQDHLMDDSVRQLWTREIASGEAADATWLRTSVPRRR